MSEGKLRNPIKELKIEITYLSGCVVISTVNFLNKR